MAITTGSVAVPANSATSILTNGTAAGWVYLSATAGAGGGSQGDLGIMLGPAGVTLANGFPFISPIYLQASDALFAICPVACTINFLLP